MIRLGTEVDPERWDRYVLEHPHGTLFHMQGWRRAVESAFGHRAHYFEATRGERVCGLLPLFEVHSLFTGRNLVSVPYGVYGGPIAEDPDDRLALLEAGQELARDRKVGFMELRQIERLPVAWPVNDLYVTFVRELPEKPEDTPLLLPRKARQATNKARRNEDLTFERYGAEALDEFYELFARNKRKLGSPPYPKKLFARLLDELEDAAIYGVMYQKRKMVAGVMTFFFRDLVMPYFSGGLEEYRALQINNYMYYMLMEEGVRLGYRRFDFGRSRRDTGPAEFKINQGFEPTPLNYQYCFVSTAEIPSFNPSNPRLDLPRRAWTHLPLWVTKLVGSYVTRYLP
ncbi:MAG: FemAB family PEP-CTERM system-associated protein [Planctomycetota bacterium]